MCVVLLNFLPLIIRPKPQDGFLAMSLIIMSQKLSKSEPASDSQCFTHLIRYEILMD